MKKPKLSPQEKIASFPLHGKARIENWMAVELEFNGGKLPTTLRLDDLSSPTRFRLWLLGISHVVFPYGKAELAALRERLLRECQPVALPDLVRLAEASLDALRRQNGMDPAMAIIANALAQCAPLPRLDSSANYFR